MKVLTHPVKELRDENIDGFFKRYEEGKISKCMVVYEYEDHWYHFRHDLNPLEAVGLMHVTQNVIEEEDIRE